MSSVTVLFAAFASLSGQAPFIESAEFSKDQQLAAVLASVRIGAAGQEGTGAIIGRRGELVYILTARHLVAGSERVAVEVFTKDSYPRAKRKYLNAESIATKAGITDLALLRLRTTDEMPGFLPICPANHSPKAASISALTVGCDSGKPPTAIVEKGVEKKIGQLQQSDQKGAFWQVQAKYPGGRSGGPMIDTNGRLLGVCSGTNQEKTYFVHLDEIHRFLIGQGLRWLTEEK